MTLTALSQLDEKALMGYFFENLKRCPIELRTFIPIGQLSLSGPNVMELYWRFRDHVRAFRKPLAPPPEKG